MLHTIVVIAAADESAALQYIAPYAGCAIGEEFMENRTGCTDYFMMIFPSMPGLIARFPCSCAPTWPGGLSG